MKTTTPLWIYCLLLALGILFLLLLVEPNLCGWKDVFCGLGSGIVASVIVAISIDFANTKHNQEKEEEFVKYALSDIEKACKKFAHSIIDYNLNGKQEMTFEDALDASLSDAFEISDAEHVSVCQGVGQCVMEALQTLTIEIKAKLEVVKIYSEHEIIRQSKDNIEIIAQDAQKCYLKCYFCLTKEPVIDVEKCKSMIMDLKKKICEVFKNLTVDFEKPQSQSNVLF